MAEKPPPNLSGGNASKEKAPSTKSDQSLASRIGNSAGSLIGDLLAPTSTTQTLASTASQGKASRGESSAAGAAAALHAGSSSQLDRGQAAGNVSMGSFRSQSNESAKHQGEAFSSEAPILSPEFVGTSTQHESREATPASQIAPSQIPRIAGESFEEYNQRLIFMEQSTNGTARLGAAAQANAEAEAATWIAQFNDASAGERSYYRDVMKHVRAGSAASERGWQQADGDEVLQLLDGGPLDLEDDTGKASTEKSTEPEVTADDLFGSSGDSFGPIARDNQANLRPDFAAMDPRVDPVSGVKISQEQDMRDVLDRMALLDQWNEVLDSYTDDVWAPEQVAKAAEARKQLEAAREEATSTEPAAQTEDRPALRRLQDLMGQLDIKGRPSHLT